MAFQESRPAQPNDTGPVAESQMQVLSFLRPDQFELIGKIPPEAVCGLMEGTNFSVERFRPNRVFIDFMHSVIKTVAPRTPSMIAAAAEQIEGYLYVIDMRTPDGPQGDVPPEDIIGAFEVKEGRIIVDSYWANDQHRVYTENGLVQLPPPLQEALVQTIMERHR